MPNSIPEDLIAAVREGRAVLFLGAGASWGAKDDEGGLIPLAGTLASDLVNTFLSPDYASYDFRTVYDLSCSARDVLSVQRYIFERLTPFQPAQFHLLVPSFAWAGLMTTNYDLIVERSYQRMPNASQRLVVNKRDGDGAMDRLGNRSLLYVKLHGCITQHHEVHPPPNREH